MTPDAQSARDDLAFIKALVGDDENTQMRTFGESYLAAGLIYGAQMILHAVQAGGFLPNTPAVGLGVGLGPTLVFIPVISWIVYKNRAKKAGQGATGRAIGNIFGAIGLANFFLIAVIGSVALQEHSIHIWLIYPCCIFVLQGTAWLFTFMMRRHGWHLAVAMGFFVTAVAAAYVIPTSIGLFILFLGIGMWGCMALPGWLILRNTRAAG